MSKPIVFMFSGQGSQYFQMGKDLFEKNTIFKEELLKGDRICQELLGYSVVNHIYDSTAAKSRPFTQILFSHPAIFLVEYALTQVLLKNHIYPDMVLGTSMGEFASAVISRAVDFETAIQAIIKQANILNQYGQEGGMLAILSDPKLYEDETYINQFSELAAVNFPSHFVVAGTQDNLKKIVAQLNVNDILYQLLPVSYGFHSSLIDNIKAFFLKEISNIKIEKPQIPFASCAEAKFLDAFTYSHFWSVVRSPIQFRDTIQHMENQQSFIYVDLGPSGTLATFVKYNLTSSSQSKSFPIVTPYSQDQTNLENILQNLKK